MVITKVYKDKQYLVFDYEDGRTVKYDFATKTAIGIRGKSVKDLKRQLSNISINELIDCCVDKQYARFLNFIRKKSIYHIDNIGTILSKVPQYSQYEQIFSAGFEDIIDLNHFTKTINDIPKSLIKAAQNRSIKISDRFCDYWEHNPNGYYLAYQLKFISLTDENIFYLLNAETYDFSFDPTTITGYRFYYSYFNKLIDEYGYNAKSLLIYIDELVTYEAFSDMTSLMREIMDYAKMMSAISPKFDKYPKNFLTTHQIASRNYNRLKKEFSEELFKKHINKDYECTIGDYMFIYPNSTQEIKDEAVNQNNCVASYIYRVIDGQCHIMFLRKRDNPDKSLVTLEIRNNKIVQAKRRYNVDITEEDKEVIDKWNKKFSNIKEEAA